MPFTPLTKEQYNSAIAAGFHPDDIISMEKRRKAQNTEVDNSWARTLSDPNMGKDVAVGFAKGAGRTAVGLEQQGVEIAQAAGSPLLKPAVETLGGPIIGRVATAIASNPAVQSGLNKAKEYLGSAEEKLQPKNLAEKLGGYAESAVELAFPVGKVGKLAKTAKDSSKIIKLAEYIMPKVDKGIAEKISAKGESGIMGLFEKVSPQKSDFAKAKDVVEAVSPNKSLAKNITDLSRDIKVVSEKELIPFLESQKGSWKINTLKRKLNAIKESMPAGLVGDSEKIYTRVIDTYLKNLRDTEGRLWKDLWAQRVKIDKEIGKQFKDVPFESMKARDRAFRQARQVVNDYIAENTKSGKYPDLMKRLSNKYDVLGNLIEKSTDRIMAFEKAGPLGKLKIKYPKTTAGLEIAAGALTTGAVVAAGKKLIGE